MAEYSAGEDAEAGQEGGKDELDGSCDALKCYHRMESACIFFNPRLGSSWSSSLLHRE